MVIKMDKTHKLLLLSGDGIGPEVMAEAEKVIELLEKNTDISFSIQHGLLGGCAYDQTGSPYPPETKQMAHEADAILLTAIGGPMWENAPFNKRPEQGLLDIRADLNLFANLRPARVFDCLLDASSLKNDLIKGLDILIIRELIGGIYFGEPRGIENLPDGKKRGFNTASYHTDEVTRIAKVAFAAAKRRKKQLCSIDKANVLESSIVWREVVTEMAKNEPNVTTIHMYADNAAMQLASNPAQFDVILAPNLAGDILSDLAAAITGSIGLLPSASLSEITENGTAKGLYEPVHGSAPDIAGKEQANPLATILSLAMLLENSLDRKDLAQVIEDAVSATLNDGFRTPDIARSREKTITTSQMGDEVIKRLQISLSGKRKAG